MGEGEQTPDIIDLHAGVPQFSDWAELSNPISSIAEQESESLFADSFSGSLENTIRRTELLGSMVNGVTLDTPFASDMVSKQLDKVAKLIKLRTELGTERAVFATNLGGF